jgi:hypothetical protein
VIHDVPAFNNNPGFLPDIALPPLTQVDIYAPVPLSPSGDCVPPTSTTGCAWNLAADCSIPLRATLTHQDIALGIPGEIVSDTSESSTCSARKSASDVCTSVTSGAYDLYVEPTDSACPIPPALVAGISTSSNSLSPYKVSFPPPQTMLGTIKTTMDLSDYRVEIVDSATGLRVSNIGVVTPPSPDSMGEVEARFGELSNGALVPLEYYVPLEADGMPRHFWIRFTPNTLPLPSYAVSDRALVFTSFAQTPALDFSEVSTAPAMASARLEDVAGEGLSGTAVLVSVDGGLIGVPSDIVASFRVTLATNPSNVGDLSVSLPPGTYDVTAFPDATSPLAMTQTTWQVAKSTGTVLGGEVFTLLPRTSFKTRIVTAAGAAAPNVVVELDSLSPNVSDFDALFGVTRPVPRGGSGITDASGDVAIPVDPGAYTLRVRFEGSSDLPWLTLPLIQTEDESLATITAAIPVELDGRIVDNATNPTGVLGGTLRVYALADATSTRSSSATSFPARYLQIGEAQLAVDASTAATSQRGHYRVLLPPTLGASASP